METLTRRAALAALTTAGALASAPAIAVAIAPSADRVLVPPPEYHQSGLEFKQDPLCANSGPHQV